MQTDIDELKKAIDIVRGSIDDATKGLPEEVFLMASELLPLVNTDLLVRDQEGRVLLAWRNDKWWGSGWHVPGGILRLRESLEDRVNRTAASELHTKVSYNSVPLEVHPIIAGQFRERSHHVSFVYDCSVPKEYVIDNDDLKPGDTGFLAWHDHFPEDMLACHMFYRKYFK